VNNYGFNNQNYFINQMNLKNINSPGISENAKNKGQKKNPIYPHKTGLENKLDVKNKPLSVAFSSLVFDLFTTEQKYIAPKLFKEIIGKLNPLFEGMQAVDAKELLLFLLEKLHQELNKIPNIEEDNNIDYARLEKDSYDENKMLQHFIKDYTEKNKSIISDTFYGIIRSTMKCNSCQKIKYSFQTCNLLIFQLKNIKEYYQKTLNNKDNYKISIYDAFDYDKREAILNMIYCNHCKGLRPGTHQQIIYILPKVLIIILNRGRNNQDFNKEFIFPPTLDLSIKNYVVNNSPEFNTHFYLQSVITRLGESGAEGHFIAYCRNGPEEDFLCYNDAVVSKATINDAMGSKISENVYEKRTPYILVYHHMNNP
jgi:ubiquitin C-terminal hydrolase